MVSVQLLPDRSLPGSGSAVTSVSTAAAATARRRQEVEPHIPATVSLSLAVDVRAEPNRNRRSAAGPRARSSRPSVCRENYGASRNAGKGDVNSNDFWRELQSHFLLLIIRDRRILCMEMPGLTTIGHIEFHFLA